MEKHMFAFPKQFSNATKTLLESQFAVLSSLSAKTFDGLEKIVALNVATGRTALESNLKVTGELLSANEPQKFFQATSDQFQPAAEKALAYSRKVNAIVSSTGAEFSKVAEAQIAETNRKVIAFVDQISQSAPAGSAAVVAAVKTTISNVNAGYEQFTKTTKQGVDAIEGNVEAAVSQFAQTVKKGPAAANAATAAAA
jgi:phasin family protein